MAVSPARAVAFEILLRVEREESYAAELLHSRLVKLSTHDQGLVTELVMGVLRWQSLLDRRLAAASSQKLERLDGEVLAALRLGVYQLQFLSRVPARAAIFESVELVKAARKRSAAPFVNAVLRKIAGAGAEDIFAEIGKSPDSLTLAQNAAHPPRLVARWIEHYGLEATRQICIQDQTVPGTAIHIHDDESRVDQPDAELAAAGVQLSPGRLLSAARRVLSGDVTGTRAYREGRISIQDEASQLVALLVGRGEKILDCCAAPGSKTALLARRNPRAKVFATELHPHRARLLQNLNRLPNVTRSRRGRASFAFLSLLHLRPHSRRRSLLRHWHSGPQPRDQVAAQSRRPARSSVAAGGHPEVRAGPACDWRAARLFHVFAGARGKRSGGGSCPRWRGGIQGRPISKESWSSCGSLARCAGRISRRFSLDPI